MYLRHHEVLLILIVSIDDEDEERGLHQTRQRILFSSKEATKEFPTDMQLPNKDSYKSSLRS